MLYFAIVAEHKGLKHYFLVYFEDLIPVITHTCFGTLLKAENIVDFVQMPRPELKEDPVAPSQHCKFEHIEHDVI